MQHTKLDYQTLALAIYILNVGIKGASSMKIRRDLDVTQKMAWYLAMRIREAWKIDLKQFLGPLELNGTYVGGKERDKHEHKKLNAGRVTVGKTAVVGVEHREPKQVQAQVVTDTTAETLTGFAHDTSDQDAQVYTDNAKAFQALTRAAHATVKRSVREYMNGETHTNDMESFWSLLKRGYYGSYHRMSPKLLKRYVNEFVGRHNIGGLDTVDRIQVIGKGLFDKHIACRLGTRKTGLDSTAI